MIRQSWFMCAAILCGAITGSTPSQPLAAQAAQSSPPAQATPASPQPAQTLSDQAQEIDGGTPTYIRPETPEQRRARVGPVDPGPNPDEKTIFGRYGVLYHIAKFERKWSQPEKDPAYVRPFAYTPFVYELYQQNENWVWVWVAEPQPNTDAQKAADAGKAVPGGRFNASQIKYLKQIQPEFSTLEVRQSAETLRFTEASDGLPKTGSWRNSLTVADMNGDGFADIIAPPQRAGDGAPAIFLGDGKGHWRRWRELAVPFAIDYGSVVAADFNKDGHMDLAFAIHLQGLRVFLGDGKGDFTDSSAGLPTDGWGSRRLAVADFDRDGYPDLIAISEGPRLNGSSAPGGKIRLFLNRKHGSKWETKDVAAANVSVAGDYLAVGKFNGDKVPDFVTANAVFSASAILYLSEAGKLSWRTPPDDGVLVPYLSNYWAVATGKLSSKKIDDAVVSFTRSWPREANAIVGKPKEENIAGVDLFSFAGKQPKRIPLMRFPSTSAISGMAVADVDGDGNQDIVFSRSDPRELVILAGDGKGGFRRVGVEGVTLEPLANYDLTMADVNGDGRPDLVIAYESGGVTRNSPSNGSIRVFLNEGPAAPAAKAGK